MGKRKVLHYKKHLLYDKTFQPIVSAINVHDHSPIICCKEKRKGRVIELQYKYNWVSLLILKYGFRPFCLPGLLRNGPQTTKEISETPFLTWPSCDNDITMEFLEIACSQRFELRNKMLLYDEKLNNIALISSSDIVNKIMHTIW